MTESESKKLNELRVVDLKNELEKRNIDTAGVKAVLLKKLQKAMTDEGLDPDTHLFKLEVDGKGTPLKKKKESSIADDEEEDGMKAETVADEKSVEETKTENDKTEPEDVKTEPVTVKTEPDSPKEEVEEKTTVPDISLKKEEAPVEETKSEEPPKSEKQEEVSPVKAEPSEKTVEASPAKLKEEPEAKEPEENVPEDKKTELKKEPIEEKKSLREDDERDVIGELLGEKEDELDDGVNNKMDYDDVVKVEDKTDVNGIDTEDSIHLTIGEDEEKFMAGEDDPVDKRKDANEERSGRGSKKQQETRKSDARSISSDRGEDKGKKINYRNLWVSGLAAITRAQDLKQIFSKLGKVVAAKVVTNAKTPGARCYGFVTMATAEDAQSCIKGLNLTELHGRLITVEAVANKPVGGNTKKPEDKRRSSVSPQRDDKRRKREEPDTPSKDATSDREDKRADRSGDVSDKGSVKGDESLSKKADESGDDKLGDESDRGGHSSDKGGEGRSSPSRRRRPPVRERLGERPGAPAATRRPNRERIQIRGGRNDVLSFSQIKEERERQRAREKERAQREEERRRREEVDRHRMVERRQKEEILRLEREREKVRLERLRLEREKLELLRLERERFEREKEDFKRQQARLEEVKRAKRAAASRDLYEERKRPVVESSRRYEPVPPPRKETRRESPLTSSISSRSRYEESSRREEPSRPRREDPPPRVKDAIRYAERSSTTSSSTFRSSRDDRGDRDREQRRDRDDTHRKSESSRMHPRYESQPVSKSEHRYGTEAWTTRPRPLPTSSSSSSRPDSSSWVGQDRKSDVSPWARSQPPQSDRRRSSYYSTPAPYISVAPSPSLNSKITDPRGLLWPVSSGNAAGIVGSSSRSGMYGMSSMSMGTSMGIGSVIPSPFPPAERYDAYKPLGSSMGRKY